MKTIRTIFLVDDDASVRSGLSRLLETAGYTVRSFASRDEYLTQASPLPGSCVVMDARMPGSEFKSLKPVRQGGEEEIPMIIITADDDPSVRRKAKKMNAAAFFHKPIDGPALIDAIEWAAAGEIGDEN